MRWDPAQYVRFADERARPFHELLARVGAEEPRRVVDLGCGPGTLTAALARRWPTADVVGIDSSPEMIGEANALAGERLSFTLGRVEEWHPGVRPDVVISNAALQWVPRHRELLRDWARALRPDGWLAFQVPANFGAPSHVLMRELAGSSRWRSRLDGVLRHEDAVAAPERYAALLLDAGLAADVWQTSYLHVLSGEDPVLEWVRGTGLRPVLQALAPDEAGEFEVEYARLLRQAYPPRAGVTLFSFARTFAVAHRR